MKRHADLIDAATLRRISVKASCDPRTIIAVLEGRTVRKLAYDRARAALEEAGFKVPAVASNDGEPVK